MRLSAKEKTTRRQFYIHIAIAPTKNADRIEWFIEKATEVGIDEISFIRCRNSERQVINLERVEKVAISAMKQSQQAWLPKLNSIIPFNDILATAADQKFIAYVDTANPAQLQAAAHPKKKYLVLVGPEGDFSTGELEQSLQNSFIKVSLGDESPAHGNRRTRGLSGASFCEWLSRD